jgi:DNA invertase Pin-like site-specific DNA recombinase
MFIRGYLRASTLDQNAHRARKYLEDFSLSKKQPVAAWYVENASGATPDRQELKRLLADASAGDIILVEAIDRLSRLPKDDWEALRNEIEAKGLRVVAVDLPTSHIAMDLTNEDEFTGRMLDAINRMMLDMMAAIARKDYEDRRRRQAEGIRKAVEAGRYSGRPINEKLHKDVAELLQAGLSIRNISSKLGCSTATVQKIKKGQIAT